MTTGSPEDTNRYTPASDLPLRHPGPPSASLPPHFRVRKVGRRAPADGPRTGAPMPGPRRAVRRRPIPARPSPRRALTGPCRRAGRQPAGSRRRPAGTRCRARARLVTMLVLISAPLRSGPACGVRAAAGPCLSGPSRQPAGAAVPVRGGASSRQLILTRRFIPVLISGRQAAHGAAEGGENETPLAPE